MEIAVSLTINYPCGGRKLINISNAFLYDHKNRVLNMLDFHNKILSLVQDDLKKKTITKEDFNYTMFNKIIKNEHTNFKRRNSSSKTQRSKRGNFNLSFPKQTNA